VNALRPVAFRQDAPRQIRALRDGRSNTK
jgi:hypothetical protein